MRHKDPELKKRISDYISNFYIKYDRTPSTTEIAKEMSICRASAQNYLVAMGKEKMLEYKGGHLLIPMMGKIHHDRSEAPLVGSIPCGPLSYEEENVECITSLPTAIFGDGPFYILRASGDSMEDEGIEDGDLVVIRRETAPKKGDLVVALDGENQNTLKKFSGIDREIHKAVLSYCNKAVYGDKTILVDELVSQGTVSHVIKAK